MTALLRQPPRWSKKTAQLVDYVAPKCDQELRFELARWIERCPRFRALITINQDKVRKKLSATDDQEHHLDVRAELLVAALIVADRRFELTFEAYGARRLGPDLTVTFRATQRFNLEVTRLRASGDRGPGPAVARLANVIAGKVRQLPGGIPNGLVIAARGLPLNEESLNAAVRLLKAHSDHKDDAFFAHYGLKDARSFYAQYLHLTVIFLLDDSTSPARATVWRNREARQPLSKEAGAGLMQSLTAAGGTSA